MNPCIIIPSRIGSSRLPRKALADIGGKPMIVRVLERLSGVSIPTFVATDDAEIARVVEAAGVKAIMTPSDCPSGSDRIYNALMQLDAAGAYDTIINVQGDMPTLDARIITSALTLLENKDVDIATLAAPIRDEAELMDAAVVKVVISDQWSVISKNADHRPPTTDHRALYFSRAPIPHGASTHYHHIGIYAYKREALKRFIALPPSTLEQAEKLEQLRALESGMRIDVAVVDVVPLGVDTAEGLEKARKELP